MNMGCKSKKIVEIKRVMEEHECPYLYWSCCSPSQNSFGHCRNTENIPIQMPINSFGPYRTERWFSQLLRSIHILTIHKWIRLLLKTWLMWYLRNAPVLEQCLQHNYSMNVVGDRAGPKVWQGLEFYGIVPEPEQCRKLEVELWWS